MYQTAVNIPAEDTSCVECVSKKKSEDGKKKQSKTENLVVVQGCEGAKLHLSSRQHFSCTKLFNEELNPDYLLHQSFYTGQLLTHKGRKSMHKNH